MTTWSDVQADVTFDYATWGDSYVGVSEITSADTQALVLSALQSMYDSSSLMQSLLNDAAAASIPIRIAMTSDGASFTDEGAYPYIAVAFSPTDYFMNDHGVMVQSTWQLELAHELSHLLGSGHDPTDAYGIGETAHDYKGDPTILQNSVAAGEGLTDSIQASYFGVLRLFPMHEVANFNMEQATATTNMWMCRSFLRPARTTRSMFQLRRPVGAMSFLVLMAMTP